jgi:hypothetical protein
MLSNTECFFVRLLRGTIVATAAVSLLVTIGALGFAAYAHLAPEPRADLARRVTRIRAATDPVNLVKQVFPADATAVKELVAKPDDVAYSLRNADEKEIFDEFNRFLDVVFKAAFDSEKVFSGWLYGDRSVELRWSEAIDDKDAANENNVNILWRSLLLDYSKRLTARAPALAPIHDKGLYPTSFERLTSPTGLAQAPYFLAWFFGALQNELRTAQQDLETARLERMSLRMTIPISLMTAASAFAYFIFIMFLFLLVSIEASVRKIAGTPSASGPAEAVAPPLGDGNASPDPA